MEQLLLIIGFFYIATILYFFKLVYVYFTTSKIYTIMEHTIVTLKFVFTAISLVLSKYALAFLSTPQNNLSLAGFFQFLIMH
jgi:hypothetical protein